VEFEFTVDSKLRKFSLERQEGGYAFKEGENFFDADIQVITPNILSVRIGDTTRRIYLAKEGNKRYVQVEGQDFLLQEPVQDEGGVQESGGKSREDMLIVKTPMPGKVIKINVEEGDEVRKNQTLAVVEAMKMENEIKSSIDGFIKKIHCSPGDLVETENPLIELGVRVENFENFENEPSG